MLQDRKIYCLQARLCSFQPGKFTGWVSEGVNVQYADASDCTWGGGRGGGGEAGGGGGLQEECKSLHWKLAWE